MKYKVKLFNKKQELIKEIEGTTIAHKPIFSFPQREANSIKLIINQQKGITSISEIESYLINEKLIE